MAHCLKDSTTYHFICQELFSIFTKLGCTKRIELSSEDSQSSALPLSYVQHNEGFYNQHVHDSQLMVAPTTPITTTY